MKKLWFAFFFLLGGLAQELRNPVNCQCIESSQKIAWRARDRKNA
jgi:hypothetical protein